jgi:hypothetical protein
MASIDRGLNDLIENFSFKFKYTIYKTFSTSSQHFQSGSNMYSKILWYRPDTFIIHLRRASGICTVDLQLTLSRYR